MKTKIIIAGLFLSFLTISCKNEEKKADTTTEAVKEVVQENTFDVSVDMIIKKDDDLILYYKDGSNEWFDDDHVVWMGVKGKNEVQTVTFKLPEGIVPIDLRLDVGRNEDKGQEPISIKKYKITYLDKSFEVNENQLLEYLKPNQCIKYDAATKLFTLQKDDKGYYAVSYTHLTLPTKA